MMFLLKQDAKCIDYRLLEAAFDNDNFLA